MSMTVIHEVWTETIGAQFGLQWCRYSDSLPLYGYRFVWRGDGGCAQQDDAPILIPRAGWMFELIQKATDAGWFVTVEKGVGSGGLIGAQ